MNTNMLETRQTLATRDKQQTIAPIIAPATARVKFRQRSRELVGNSHIFITVGRRSRERHSPEWRPANRQSGDWRTGISTSSSQINFGIQVYSVASIILIQIANAE
jgi:hypothetical protein